MQGLGSVFIPNNTLLALLPHERQLGRVVILSVMKYVTSSENIRLSPELYGSIVFLLGFLFSANAKYS